MCVTSAMHQVTSEAWSERLLGAVMATVPDELKVCHRALGLTFCPLRP